MEKKQRKIVVFPGLSYLPVFTAPYRFSLALVCPTYRFSLALKRSCFFRIFSYHGELRANECSTWGHQNGARWRQVAREPVLKSALHDLPLQT